MFGIYSGARGGLVIYTLGIRIPWGFSFSFFFEMEGKGIDWYVR